KIRLAKSLVVRDAAQRVVGGSQTGVDRRIDHRLRGGIPQLRTGVFQNQQMLAKDQIAPRIRKQRKNLVELRENVPVNLAILVSRAAGKLMAQRRIFR